MFAFDFNFFYFLVYFISVCGKCFDFSLFLGDLFSLDQLSSRLASFVGMWVAFATVTALICGGLTFFSFMFSTAFATGWFVSAIFGYMIVFVTFEALLYFNLLFPRFFTLEFLESKGDAITQGSLVGLLVFSEDSLHRSWLICSSTCYPYCFAERDIFLLELIFYGLCFDCSVHSEYYKLVFIVSCFGLSQFHSR